MELLKHQEELLLALRTAAKCHQTNEFIHKTEWLGFLPYGLYHWLEINNEHIKLSNPDTLTADLEILEDQKLIKKLKVIKLDEEYDVDIYYELSP